MWGAGGSGEQGTGLRASDPRWRNAWGGCRGAVLVISGPEGPCDAHQLGGRRGREVFSRGSQPEKHTFPQSTHE